MLEVYYVAAVRLQAVNRASNYTSQNARSANKNFRMSVFFTYYLFTQSISPAWRHVVTITSLTSLHLMYNRLAWLTFRYCNSNTTALILMSAHYNF